MLGVLLHVIGKMEVVYVYLTGTGRHVMVTKIVNSFLKYFNLILFARLGWFDTPINYLIEY